MSNLMYRARARTHTHTTISVGFLWTSDRTVTDISTWQHTILTRDRRQCHRWDSKRQPQQASRRTFRTLTTRSLGSACIRKLSHEMSIWVISVVTYHITSFKMHCVIKMKSRWASYTAAVRGIDVTERHIPTALGLSTQITNCIWTNLCSVLGQKIRFLDSPELEPMNT